jgi:DNA-binding transcriptional regulator LsrR (DeoR family)
VELATRSYVTDQFQVQIAKSLGLDPSTVSRYLKRAGDERIVMVEIQRPAAFTAMWPLN